MRNYLKSFKYKWSFILCYAYLQMTQLIKIRLEMTLEVLLILLSYTAPYLLLSTSSSWLLCMAPQSILRFLMKISYIHSPKMRTTNEQFSRGLWPEMYGTSESHISQFYIELSTVAIFANPLLFEKGGARKTLFLGKISMWWNFVDLFSAFCDVFLCYSYDY